MVGKAIQTVSFPLHLVISQDNVEILIIFMDPTPMCSMLMGRIKFVPKSVLGLLPQVGHGGSFGNSYLKQRYNVKVGLSIDLFIFGQCLVIIFVSWGKILI